MGAITVTTATAPLARRGKPERRRRSGSVASRGEWWLECERRSWPQLEWHPHPGLRQFLARDHWGVTAQAQPHRLVIPATVAVPLVLKLRDSPHRPPAFLHGVHDHYAVMDGECAPSYLSTLMAPLGGYQILGRPICELEGGIVDLEEVFGPAGRRLLEEVRDAPTWRQRFALVDAFLLAAAQRGPRPRVEVTRAWQVLSDSGGAVPIRQLAQEVGWSHKHLIAQFTQKVGLPPKTVARLVRFHRAVARLPTGVTSGWSQLAVESGYADQSHLIREFRDFAGITPARYPQPSAGCL